MELNLDKLDRRPEHFGVLMSICVFKATVIDDVDGFEVTPMSKNRGGESFFLTKDQAIGSTARIDGVSLRLVPAEEQVLYAERAVHLQRIRELEAQVAARAPHYRTNGTTDVHAVSFLIPHIQMLTELVKHIEETIEHID